MKNVISCKSIISKVSILIIATLCFPYAEKCLAAARSEVKIPDISGYRTLKCDFHNHTIFSDGQVWPTVRIEEAWREGLDAIAITDHIEYKPHRQDVKPDAGRAYDIAKPSADEKGIILIRGAEITRNMPPGHFNAYFFKDVKPLDNNDWREVMKNVIAQGGIIVWNHPGWEGQQPDGIPRWYSEHTEIYEKGWMQGIEIVNETSYYPLAHKWAIEKKIAITGNSDIHEPVEMAYDYSKGEHRPMTLVFARDCNEDGIKEAILARRTAVYSKNNLYGEEKFLKPIFEKSILIPEAEVIIKGKSKTYVRIHNNSAIDFELVANGSSQYVSGPANITLYSDKTVLFAVAMKQQSAPITEKISIPYKVKNLMVAPDEGLKIELPINIKFIPAD